MSRYNDYIFADSLYKRKQHFIIFYISLMIIPLLAANNTTMTTTSSSRYNFTITPENEETLITPENVRFALYRCKNDLNINFKWDNTLIWMPWRIILSSQFVNEYNNKRKITIQTPSTSTSAATTGHNFGHCYVKCFLMKLGLINLKHRGLNDEKILNQIYLNNVNNKDKDSSGNKNENYISHQNDLESLLKGPLDGTCLDYHYKWIEIMENYGKIIRKSFYGYKKDIIRFYKKYPFYAKIPGDTSINFCNINFLRKQEQYNFIKQFISSEKTTTKIQLNNVTKSYKCYLKCIFQHFYYFDAYGRVDENEILRSTQEAEYLNTLNIKRIKLCVHNANQLYLQGLCDVAYELYKCFLNKVYGAQDIIKYKNELSRFY